MRFFSYRVTYLAGGGRRIEFSAPNLNGKRFTLRIPESKRVHRSRVKLKRLRGVEQRNLESS
jgi:hypothetical protein